MLCPIFLDFDGVLNSHQHFVMSGRRELPPADTLEEADFNRAVRDLNPYNIWNLNYILQNVPNSRIVFSTSWRNSFSMDVLTRALAHYGVDPTRVIGKTEKLSRRHQEIELWLDTCQPKHYGFERVEKFIVLDDYYVFESKREGMFRTDQMTGLSFRDACMVIEYFEPEWRRPLILM